MKLLGQFRIIWNDLEHRQRLQLGYALIAILAAVLGWSLLSGKLAALERQRAAREAVLAELMKLKAAYHSARRSSELLTGRMAALQPDDSPARILEEIAIRGKGIKINPLKREERGAFIEDAADVHIEGLTFNEAINLIYRLEKGNRPLVIRKVNLKVRFDDPARCDLSMILILMKPVPGQAR